MDYIWLKALHVTAVLTFVSGLFVQTLVVAAGRDGGSTTLGLVSRWDQRVTTPAMLAVWLTGATVAASGGLFASTWLWVKLVFVVALSGLHGVQSGRLRRLRLGQTLKVAGHPFSMPIAVLCTIASIATLAVTKPF